MIPLERILKALGVFASILILLWVTPKILDLTQVSSMIPVEVRGKSEVYIVGSIIYGFLLALSIVFEDRIYGFTALAAADGLLTWILFSVLDGGILRLKVSGVEVEVDFRLLLYLIAASVAVSLTVGFLDRVVEDSRRR